MRANRCGILVAVLTSHRKQHILEVLGRTGQVVAKELSQELGLSEDTIRRDLRELGSQARCCYLQHFLPERMAGEYLNLYRSCLSGREAAI